MKQIHNQEKKQFRNLFIQEAIDRIEDRCRVLEAFLETEHHLTVDEMVQRLEKNGHNLNSDFVRETLQLMCKFGFAQQNRFDNGHIRYEHRHLGKHHDHMVCTKCRQVIEFENEAIESLQTQIAAQYGFYMLQHKMEIYGICSNCQQARLYRMPLSAAKQGERLLIKSIIGGRKAQMRLVAMGLRPGDELEVISNQNNGPMVVAADFQRYVIGPGLAKKIIVQSKRK
jgi:Fur family ferric uptake transcriptional regulator